MLSPLRNRFGIPGVISVIALVFAMLGGAYAANNSGGGKATASAKGKPGPRGPRGKPGPPGPAGPQGPAGAAGAKGDTGAAGANGKDGTNGTNGATGPTGKTGATGASGSTGATGPTGATGATGFSGFTETLPSGKTETGAWVLSNPLPGAASAVAPINFTIPLSAADAAGLSQIAGTIKVVEKEEPAPTGCTGGSRTKPKANPGFLCIYIGHSDGGFELPVSVLRTDLEGFGVDTSGALLYVEMSAGGVGTGTWAVTAP